MSYRMHIPAEHGARALSILLYIVGILVHLHVVVVSAQGSTPSWQTLSGEAPLVIARGGFSGLLPDSSFRAYKLALGTGLPNTILWCDVQLTKDGVGICFPDIKLNNASDIDRVYPNEKKNYTVNGISTSGWFAADYTFTELLANVSLFQKVMTRNPAYYGYPIMTVDAVLAQLKSPQASWLNIQHDTFYSQLNISMRAFVLAAANQTVVSHISSPEVAFLQSLVTQVTQKLVFRFLQQDETEVSTNQTYGSLLTNLTFIKTFASGILVPKSYIWPVDGSNYLLPHTSLVQDAHTQGLEVYAADFANDFKLSYNYSHDPIAEYQSFVDNGEFSVDGVLTDFPITPSAVIDCFSHLDVNAKEQVKILIISKNGASGDYPGCTDLAYQKAITDGVDVLDCPVQMSQDGVPFCLSYIKLENSTTVIQSPFSNLTTSIPEFGDGIYTFSLTWSQIQTLKPAISNPYHSSFRNPKNKNAGKFLSLSDFLALTKNTGSLSGILISVENAAYLAEKQGMDIVGVVLDTLGKSGYSNQTTQRVMIQSTNSSVLTKFKEKSKYELVYQIDKNIRDVLDSAAEEIKKFATSVVVSKKSVFPVNKAFVTNQTDVVEKLQKLKLAVYVETFSNEFLSQAWDFLADSTVEINSFVQEVRIDGVVTDFPETSARYRRNRCLSLGDKMPSYMRPVQVPGLKSLINDGYFLPAPPPNPVLTDTDVAEAPLPSVKAKTPTVPGGGSTEAASPPQPSGQPIIGASIFLSSVATMLLSTVLLF